jgi:molybdenum cofactor guanylyltransferase
MPRVLGAIIAGGNAKRFGSDKAAALLNGKALIDHVADGLRQQCDSLIICGRDWAGFESIADRPAADMGPLGGLCAALHYAAQHGFDEVVTAGCDVLPVPLIPSTVPCVIEGHYLHGRWPAKLAGLLDKHLASQSDYSMRAWMRVIGAAQIPTDMVLHNLNSPQALRDYEATSGA